MSSCKEVQPQLRAYASAIRSSDPESCRYTLFPSLPGFESIAEHVSKCKACQEVFGNVKEYEQREDQELCLRCGKPRSAHLKGLATYFQLQDACSIFQAPRNSYVFKPSHENDK